MDDDIPDDLREDAAATADAADHRPPPDAPRAEEVVAEALERMARGATELVETAVGLGVLGLNRVQALRRDLQARIDHERSADVDEPDA